MWFFPQLLVLSSYFILLDVMGDQGPQLSKLAFRGGVRIINPPLSKFGHMSKSRVMSKSGVHPVYF